jgi:hypothetical protein
MNRVLLLALAGCGSTTTQPTRPAREPLPPAIPAVMSHPPAPNEFATRMITGACAILDREVELAAPLHLMVHGKRFAAVTRARELDVRAAGVGATAAVTTDAILIGDVDLRQQPVRPRQPLHAGWLGIRHALPGTAHDGTLTIDLHLPRGVIPVQTPHYRLACGELTFGTPPPLPAAGTAVWLRDASTIALHRDARGPVIATIETPRIDPGTHEVYRQRDAAALEARELGRTTDRVRVRLGADNYAEGWIDAAMLGAPQPPTLRPQPDPRPSPRPATTTVRCPHDVAIYVRDGDVIRVGTYPAGAPIARLATDGAEVPVDLGLPPKLPVEPPGTPPALDAFVRASALAGCSTDCDFIW